MCGSATANGDGHKNPSTLEIARQYRRAGLSIIPIRPDGSKAPALPSWKEFQERQMTEEELPQHFSTENGIGIICGAVSGHLEVIDFDEPTLFPQWIDALRTAGSITLVESLVEVKTPSGGRHIYYRGPGAVGRNQKLACSEKPDPITGKQTLIETRGEGGYVLAPGSPAQCHELCRTYDLIRGSLADIPILVPETRALLFNAARSFNQKTATKREFTAAKSASNERLGDEFNRVGTWDFLTEHGWREVRTVEESTHWCRPNKESGVSATTNQAGSDLLRVFSSNAHPFEPGTSYTKFTAYTLLNHDGDFAAAVKSLAESGLVSNSVSIGLDDIGNAERFVKLFGQDVRWVSAFHKWLTWSGKRWEIDEREKVLGMAKKAARSILKESRNNAVSFGMINQVRN